MNNFKVLLLIARSVVLNHVFSFQLRANHALKPTNRYGLRSLQALDDLHSVGDIGTHIAASMPMLQSKLQSILDSPPSSSFLISAEEAASVYSKVDKTGFIGFIADGIEKIIDFGHETLKQTGLKSTYGFSIIAFTIFGKHEYLNRLRVN